MTRPTVLDMDLVVVPSKADVGMLGAWYRYKNGFRFAGEEPARDTSDVGAYSAMLSASPYPTAWDDVRKYVEEMEEEVGRLVDENSDLRYEPWPEWARAVLKVIRSHTGYDGYDDATDGVDMPLELSEHLSQVESDTDRWKSRAESAADRIAELEAEKHAALTMIAMVEKRLADAERVIEPFAERANDYHNDYPDDLAVVVQLGHLRAAREEFAVLAVEGK